MYIISNHNTKIAEWSTEAGLRDHIDDLDAIMERNQMARKIMAEKDSGRPGHYYGRDIVIEAEIPAAMFAIAPMEYGDDPDWWKDDAKFQDYMARHPGCSWLNG